MVITELKSNVSQLVLSVPSLNPVVVSTQRFVASSPSLRMRFTSQWPFGLYIRTKVRDVGRRKKRGKNSSSTKRSCPEVENDAVWLRFLGSDWG